MKNKTIMSIGAVVTAVALAGCSSATRSQAHSGIQTTSAADTSRTSSSPTTAAATSQSAPSSTNGPTTSSTTAATAQPKPVSALLAGIAAPVTTANMPKAQPEWIAAVQKSDDLGHDISGKLSPNLVALVDEAAKTSDVDALLKLCNLCDIPKLNQVLTATDSSGLTGFQELSRVLERTHPASSYTHSAGWDFPGFTRPEKGAPTGLDQQDMTLLGAYAKPYTGIRAQFMNLNDGPNAYDGWTGLGTPNT